MATVERQRADVRAAEAESRMSQFWRLSNDLLAIFSSDGRFLQASAAWERTLGWTPEELIGRSALEFVVDDDRAATQAGAGPALSGADTAPEVVSRVRAKDGTARWLLWSMHQGPDGSLYAVAKDITERHEQQALTARREEQLNDAQRLARLGSWEVDFVSGRSTLSASLREMLALDAEGGVLDRVHPEDRERVEAAIANTPARRVPRPAARRRAARVRVARPAGGRRRRRPDGPGRHDQGRHGAAARGDGAAPLRGALPPGLRQRADRDVADRPGDVPLRAGERRLLQDGRADPRGARRSCRSPRSATPTSCRRCWRACPRS